MRKILYVISGCIIVFLLGILIYENIGLRYTGKKDTVISDDDDGISITNIKASTSVMDFCIDTDMDYSDEAKDSFMKNWDVVYWVSPFKCFWDIMDLSSSCSYGIENNNDKIRIHVNLVCYKMKNKYISIKIQNEDRSETFFNISWKNAYKIKDEKKNYILSEQDEEKIIIVYLSEGKDLYFKCSQIESQDTGNAEIVLEDGSIIDDFECVSSNGSANRSYYVIQFKEKQTLEYINKIKIGNLVMENKR